MALPLALRTKAVTAVCTCAAEPTAIPVAPMDVVTLGVNLQAAYDLARVRPTKSLKRMGFARRVLSGVELGVEVS